MSGFEFHLHFCSGFLLICLEAVDDGSVSATCHAHRRSSRSSGFLLGLPESVVRMWGVNWKMKDVSAPVSVCLSATFQRSINQLSVTCQLSICYLSIISLSLSMSPSAFISISISSPSLFATLSNKQKSMVEKLKDV